MNPNRQLAPLNIAFPLTLALSLREREQAAARLGLLNTSLANPIARHFLRLRTVLPLPKGAGRGEGEARGKLTTRCFLAAPLLLLIVLFSGCGKSDSAKPTERKVLYYQSAMHPWIKSDKPGRCTICGMELTPVYEGQAGFDVSGDVITLSSNSIRVLNVQTIEAKVQPLTKTLTVAGTIDDDDSKHRVLSAYVGGRVEKLHVTYVGAEVKAGDPLVDLYSPMLLTAVRDYLVVQRGAADAPLAAAAASRLKQLGLSDAQIEHLPHTFSETNLTIPLLAPISGTVVEKKVYAGQYVQEGERLLELADFSTMWFMFRAYEQDLPWLRAGQKVDVSTPSLPGKVVTGIIKFIDPNLDEATRSIKVRVELENPLVDGRRLFSHRLYADGVVHLDAPEVVAIPRTAIIQTGPQAVVFIEQGGGGYARRVLKLGRHGDKLIEVLDGLAAGDKVVVNGNLLIDGQAEMNRSYASPAEKPMSTNAPATGLPRLTDTQRRTVQAFVALTDAVTAALAADDLNEFNVQAAKFHAALPALKDSFVDADKSWHPLLKGIEESGHLEKAGDLKAARKTFLPFSTAAVAFAQALRRSEKEFASLKVFRCPMTKNVFPGAPASADWIQLKPVLSNPYMGVQMNDCGTEVKQ